MTSFLLTDLIRMPRFPSLFCLRIAYAPGTQHIHKGLELEEKKRTIEEIYRAVGFNNMNQEIITIIYPSCVKMEHL